MPKRTVLDLTQDILSDMESDEVNSIEDTSEALQVAQILKTTYYDLIDEDIWPHLKENYQLVASGTTARPTHMSIADNIQHVEWIKYNKRLSSDTRDKFEDVIYKTPKEFMDILDARVSSNSNIDSITDDVSNQVWSIVNDAPPSYWTSFDDVNIVFDSYDSGVDSTLLTAKTRAYVYKEPTFSMTDTHVPDLPSRAFSYYLSTAKAACFDKIKQSPNRTEEGKKGMHKRAISQTKHRYQGQIVYANYGRKR